VTWLPSQAGGGLSSLDIDGPPTGTSITYNGATGTLVSSSPGSGLVEGWKVVNWGDFVSITENGGDLMLEGSTAGQQTPSYTGDFLRSGMYIYHPDPIVSDFDLAAKFAAMVGAHTSTIGGVIAFRLGSATIYDSMISAAVGGWSGTHAKGFARTMRYGNSLTDVTSGTAEAWPRWARARRVVQATYQDWSPDGSSWASLQGPLDRDYAGGACYVGIGFGANAGVAAKIKVQHLRFAGSFHPSP
jgi:hypothetical protein